MKISVVMPYKNAILTLEEAMVSILEQSYGNFELIVIDDHSNDNSRSVVEKLEKLDNRIVSIPNREKGIVGALNTGLAAAKAKYIARMDADDISLPKRLEKQIEKMMEQSDLGLTSCLAEHWNTSDQHRDEGFQQYIHWVNSLVSESEIYLNRFVESPLPHPTVFFKRELIDQFGGYRSGDFPEDYELWLRWMKNGVKMEKVNEVLLRWRDGNNRLSRTDQRYHPDAFYQIKTTYLAEHLIRNRIQQVWIWGAGRKSRQRAKLLEAYGINIKAYIDLNADKTTTAKCISYKDLPDPADAFILSYVANRGAREEIRDFLLQKGYREGDDFLMVG